MSEPVTWFKVLHVLSATVLFGTGLGTAFHMWMAHRTADARVIAAAADSTVKADFWFTLPAVIVQPATGLVLLWLEGFSLTDPWIVAALTLYVLVGLAWLPVVRIQIKIRDIAQDAVARQVGLPAEYLGLMQAWIRLGWVAFPAVVAIFWLMIDKPALW